MGLCEVIGVDCVLALLLSEVMGKNVVAPVAVALVIAVLLIVTVSDLVVGAVVVAFVAVAPGSSSFTVFGKADLSVAGAVTEVIVTIFVGFVVII